MKIKKIKSYFFFVRSDTTAAEFSGWWADIRFGTIRQCVLIEAAITKRALSPALVEILARLVTLKDK